MTCIVGYLNGGKVFMGGDSAGTAGYSQTIRADEKVFVKNKMIFGFTSSFRMGQLLRYSFEIPKHPKEKSDYEYLVTDFISAVKNVIKIMTI